MDETGAVGAATVQAPLEVPEPQPSGAACATPSLPLPEAKWNRIRGVDGLVDGVWKVRNDQTTNPLCEVSKIFLSRTSGLRIASVA